jgi:hypothetical protein
MHFYSGKPMHFYSGVDIHGIGTGKRIAGGYAVGIARTESLIRHGFALSIPRETPACHGLGLSVGR